MVSLAIGGVFLVVDGGFFAANLLKIGQGGWLPLSFAAVLFLVMITWRTGVDAVRAALGQTPQAATLTRISSSSVGGTGRVSTWRLLTPR